jgi:hypothetical protein
MPPRSSFPEPSFPEPSFPEPSFPGPSFPDPGFPESSLPSAPPVPPHASVPQAAARRSPAGSPVGSPTGSPAQAEPWLVPRQRQRSARRRGGRARTLLLTVAVATVALLAAGGIFVLTKGGGEEKGRPQGTSARLAGGIFGPDPAAKTDGRDQELNAVAALGSTVVAIGGESDNVAYRPQFLVSTDEGRSFRLADVRAADGAEAPPAEIPTHLVGTTHGWVALGSRLGGSVLWTSGDGRAWTRQPNVAAFGPKDRVNGLIGTKSGFIAVGANSANGDFKDAAPVVWLSPNGRSWERRAGNQLNMSARGGALSLVNVAVNGDLVIAQGIRVKNPAKDRPDAHAVVWRSADGGRTWQETPIPAPKGTAGLNVAATPSGFLAAREVHDKSGDHAVTFVSADGASWEKTGELRFSGYVRVSRLSASSQGVAALVAADQRYVVMRSADGKTWRNSGTVPLGAGRTVQQFALATNQTIVVGRDRAGQNDADALLAVRTAQGAEVPVDLSRVAGAQQNDQDVRALAVGAGGKVAAVGSSNGAGAVWTSTDGAAWNRATSAGGAFDRPGQQRLLDVTTGDQGWLAVGYSGVVPFRPLVVTSKDGATWQAADGAAAFKATAKTALATYGAAAGPKGYVIVGEEGLSAATWFSTDLKSWQRGGAARKEDLAARGGANRWMRAAVGGPFGFVAVGGLTSGSRTDRPGRRPAVWTSADGSGWRLQELRLPAGASEGWLPYVVAKGNVLLAAGTAVTSAGRRPFGYLSVDGGRSWRATQPTAKPGSGDVSVTGVTATPSGFVVAGTTGRPGTSDVVTWTSPDGGSWTYDSPAGVGLNGRGDQDIAALAAVGTNLVAVGTNADHVGREPTLWRRPLP